MAVLEWFFDWWDDRTLGAARSSNWSAVRRAFIDAHPFCAVCNKRGTLLSPNEAHHKEMFNLRPELELEISNLITLCRRCHLIFGHLGNFRSYNVDIEVDARIWRDKLRLRP